jgi:hypothetical protein
MAITTPEFRSTLSPLIDQRRAEGFKIVIIETTNLLTADEIQRADGVPMQTFIQQLIQTNKGACSILLAGAMATADKTRAPGSIVPPLQATTGRMRGLPTDYGFAEGSKGTPVVAVGRFPARSVQELRQMVEKTLRFENDRRPAAWQNSIVLLQGNPGGGPLAETVIEQTTLPRLEQLHPAFSLRAISHCVSSRFYVPTDRLHDLAMTNLEVGQLFSLYLGHSDPSGLWSGEAYFMNRADWATLKIGGGSGVFLTCGCYACQSESPAGEGYGLAAMRNPNGPVAVIGACGESYSMAGLLATDGFLKCCSHAPFPYRLGDYWLAIQDGLAHGEIDPRVFALFDQFDGSGGKVPLAVQRLEHLEMWMLLGDPALRLPLVPLDLTLKSSAPVIPGRTIKVDGTLPMRLLGASVQMTLERTIGSVPAVGFQKMPDSTPEHRLEHERVALENHRRANGVILGATNIESSAAQFTCSIEAPRQLSWSKVVVRAYASTTNDAALGILILPVGR